MVDAYVPLLGLDYRYRKTAVAKAWRYTTIEEFAVRYPMNLYGEYFETPTEEVSRRVSQALQNPNLAPSVEPGRVITINEGIGSGLSLTREKYNQSLEEIGLSQRVCLLMERHGFLNLGSVLTSSERELQNLPWIGPVFYEELKTVLTAKGFLPPPQNN